MKSNTSKLTVSALVILIFLAFNVLGQNPYTHSESITCGNNLCEASSLELNIGEEKSKFIGKQSYAFKLVNIEKIENPYLSYNFYLSINNGPSMLADEAKKEYNINFNCCALIGIQEGQGQSNPQGAQINFAEGDICGPLPDCAFPVELDIYKKWNLVPLYLASSIKGAGTCKLEDFKVIYSYNPIQNNHVKLYSFGDSARDFELAAGKFQTNFESGGIQSETILAGTIFNSVWVYSGNECKLSSALPKNFENFLLVLKQLSERTIQRPFRSGESPPPPEKIITTFAPGWNFFVGSKDMQGKSLDEIKGNCNIEKAYTFDASSQSWKQLTTAPGPADNFIFKVTSKCMFGFPEIAPPEIPT